jgi:hypothetical protein
MTSGELSPDERAELERLRAQVAAYEGAGRAEGGRRPSRRRLRWVGACALLLVSAVLSGLSVVAVYLRAEVLDTETYVQTVAPLARDITVREAVANRLVDEIITRTDIAGLANQVAEKLVAQGAPERVEDLVEPAINGVRSFLYDKIYQLLGTPQFQTIWDQVNRLAHEGLVTVLTGGKGRFVASTGTTVTVDLGALLSAAKQQLVARGVKFVSRVPDVSIPYEIIDSKELPTLRRYVRLLDSAATWLPFVALGLLGLGVLAAPNRRRGIITGFAMVAVVVAASLGALALARGYYLDHLPPTIRSPDAAAVVIDTLLRYLMASLQTLLAVAAIFVVAALLAGPSRIAMACRKVVNYALDAAARGLAHAGSWVAKVGRALLGARRAIQIAVVLAAVVGLILANRPGISAVLWTTAIVLLLFTLIEIFVRAPASAQRHSALP